jgi:hypothetical protein
LDVQRRDPERSLTKDEMLDDITLHWLTNSATSSAQLYWENNDNNFNAVEHHRKRMKKSRRRQHPNERHARRVHSPVGCAPGRDASQVGSRQR